MSTSSIETSKPVLPANDIGTTAKKIAANDPAPPRLTERSRSHEDMRESSSSVDDTEAETSERVSAEPDSIEPDSVEPDSAEQVGRQPQSTVPMFTCYGAATATTSVTIMAFSLPAIMWLTPDTITSHTLLILAALGAGAAVGVAGSLIHHMATGAKPALQCGSKRDDDRADIESAAAASIA